MVRGDPATRAFAAFWTRDRRVVAGMHVNQWGAIDRIQDLVRAGSAVDPARLADPGVALEELVGALGDSQRPGVSGQAGG